METPYGSVPESPALFSGSCPAVCAKWDLRQLCWRLRYRRVGSAAARLDFQRWRRCHQERLLAGVDPDRLGTLFRAQEMPRTNRSGCACWRPPSPTDAPPRPDPLDRDTPWPESAGSDHGARDPRCTRSGAAARAALGKRVQTQPTETVGDKRQPSRQRRQISTDRSPSQCGALYIEPMPVSTPSRHLSPPSPADLRRVASRPGGSLR